ncbi:MAG TPA: hypothetical protein VE669_12190, partial [Actinomycetota bacterium]|nr:hypothetical protein [Actinomycetota bacterium]
MDFLCNGTDLTGSAGRVFDTGKSAPARGSFPQEVIMDVSRSWFRWVVVLALGMLVLGACAPGEEEEGGQTGATGAEETGDILIASAMPLTGPYASDGEEMNQALEMAIDDYNAEGGVL